MVRKIVFFILAIILLFPIQEVLRKGLTAFKYRKYWQLTNREKNHQLQVLTQHLI